MVLDRPGEFHPHAFCVWKKAGLDPWPTMLWLNERLGWVQPDALPTRPPLVSDLREYAPQRSRKC